MDAVRLHVDDEAVAGELRRPDGEARGTLLLVHGMLSSVGELRDSPEALARRGWRVLALDLRGHGDSEGERGWVTRERAMEDVEAALAWCRDRGWTPAAAAGHSLGTAWVLSALPRFDDLACGAILSPVARITDEVSRLEYVLYRVGHALHRAKAGLGLGPLYAKNQVGYDDILADPQDVAWAREEAFLQPRINLRSVPTYLEVDNVAWAQEVTEPCQVLVSARDLLVEPEAQREVHAALAGPSPKVEVDAGHSLFAGRAREEVVGYVDGFLDEHLAGAGSSDPS
jgi:alpha-beta hydrolase superfamily lysophospholipase